MKTPSCGLWAHSTFFLASAALLSAHPGHDGHELTWDFGHLAQHSWATMGCVVMVGGALGALLQALRRAGAPEFQSFRGSHTKRGK